MSRRYPTAELYEERQRDFYRNGNRSDRSYDELDLEISQGNPRRSAPDFLREDYGRIAAGPLAVRERITEDSRGSPRRREVEEDTLVIRGGRREERPREREEISIRRGDRERPRPREVNTEETDIVIRHRDEESRPRPREVREVDREEITFRRGEVDKPRPREREVEREEIRFRRGEREPPRPREVETEEFIYRRDESRPGREREYEKDTVIVRPRERSLPPPRPRGDLVAREREEFVVRRRERTPPREDTKDEIIIRRMEQRSPSPPPPPPEPEAIVRPPIIQEVITHHRHIDHGVERARSPTPPPPLSPPREDTLEISLRRHRGGGKSFYDEDIIYERETRERKERDFEIERTRRRSLSAPRRRFTVNESDLDSEAEFYNRKAMERAYMGEAYNGATKDWAIVDVPPGTNRVKMDGIGGGSQEITWQKYNGVRRSKFLSGDDEISSDIGRPLPSKARSTDMWTEITKDLVIKEAIESMGFDYEETDYFFYVMEYLRYEDVLQLVELSDEIRHNRRSRIRQIEYEREEMRDRRPKYDERYYEHDVSYESRRSRYR
ncbi:hypothetical protein K432DRAFT_287153 [Lepidopterella palustris CBS 459.81]|uniref:DUF8035 domain-containing protein n=1 Tax=Lepidopterella palustris CBS 459.81 TaxID=1314670 RepID=A0A8E2EJZ3_9PEZI|nr:hypothetical protein K432DRAFT_287153 [Lepidopterella palustris CBS 459.81]